MNTSKNSPSAHTLSTNIAGKRKRINTHVSDTNDKLYDKLPIVLLEDILKEMINDNASNRPRKNAMQQPKNLALKQFVKKNLANLKFLRLLSRPHDSDHFSERGEISMHNKDRFFLEKNLSNSTTKSLFSFAPKKTPLFDYSLIFDFPMQKKTDSQNYKADFAIQLFSSVGYYVDSIDHKKTMINTPSVRISWTSSFIDDNIEISNLNLGLTLTDTPKERFADSRPSKKWTLLEVQNGLENQKNEAILISLLIEMLINLGRETSPIHKALFENMINDSIPRNFIRSTLEKLNHLIQNEKSSKDFIESWSYTVLPDIKFNNDLGTISSFSRRGPIIYADAYIQNQENNSRKSKRLTTSATKNKLLDTMKTVTSDILRSKNIARRKKNHLTAHSDLMSMIGTSKY